MQQKITVKKLVAVSGQHSSSHSKRPERCGISNFKKIPYKYFDPSPKTLMAFSAAANFQDRRILWKIYIWQFSQVSMVFWGRLAWSHEHMSAADKKNVFHSSQIWLDWIFTCKFLQNQVIQLELHQSMRQKQENLYLPPCQDTSIMFCICIVGHHINSPGVHI